MSDILSIAASGLRAYQTALTTTSENIANAGTAGYVRRTSAVREVTSTGVTNMNGMGVVAAGISRQNDVYRAGEVRLASTDLARSETAATWLERVQGALTGNQLSGQLTAFFTSARTAAGDPSNLGPRQAMLEAASSVAAGFTATGNALDAAMADLDATMDAAVGQLNGLGATLARVNFALGNVSPNTSNAAALLDQRDQLLEQMSAIADINVTLDPAGRAVVRQGGATGPVLVQGVFSATVTAVRNDSGAISYSAFLDGNVQALSPTGGVLAGAVEGAAAIASARDQLNTLAQNFADSVNTVQAGGENLAGTPGAAMFTVGDPASHLTLALNDPRAIAAAGPGKGARDNSNLLALDAIRAGGAEQALTNLITANGGALNTRKAVVDAQSAIHTNAVAARDAVTGVNIDEEAVDLIRFQQAYQASGRVIQVAREVLQSIFEIR
ncbi:flagellar hook-associated protein FlgK [Sphingomonas soli]|uniref:flagellar hook-associated protein FlgK n=1 Tax=Sphingomonas soli TaxID=266127 RepID=UPI000830D53C|nr:flagellar hook-associated protein FlgK [Sphingomonas soli]